MVHLLEELASIPARNPNWFLQEPPKSSIGFGSGTVNRKLEPSSKEIDSTNLTSSKESAIKTPFPGSYIIAQLETAAEPNAFILHDLSAKEIFKPQTKEKPNEDDWVQQI
ncbi:hypothetical protein C8J56DRAFT_894326 [Mycena floridula]|nr:hypothetical protein C8J56DRAFT_894326 [Mycena floridula]